jgi:hypothetical protein
MNVLALFRLSSIVRFFHLVKGMHVQPYQLMSEIIDCQVDYVILCSRRSVGASSTGIDVEHVLMALVNGTCKARTRPIDACGLSTRDVFLPCARLHLSSNHRNSNSGELNQIARPHTPPLSHTDRHGRHKHPPPSFHWKNHQQRRQ